MPVLLLLFHNSASLSFQAIINHSQTLSSLCAIFVCEAVVFFLDNFLKTPSILEFTSWSISKISSTVYPRQMVFSLFVQNYFLDEMFDILWTVSTRFTYSASYLSVIVWKRYYVILCTDTLTSGDRHCILVVIQYSYKQAYLHCHAYKKTFIRFPKTSNCTSFVRFKKRAICASFVTFIITEFCTLFVKFIPKTKTFLHSKTHICTQFIKISRSYICSSFVRFLKTNICTSFIRFPKLVLFCWI